MHIVEKMEELRTEIQDYEHGVDRDMLFGKLVQYMYLYLNEDFMAEAWYEDKYSYYQEKVRKFIKVKSVEK